MDSDAVSLLGVDATAHVYGGRLCLAIVNSIWYRRGPAPEEHLGTYAELIDLVAGAGWHGKSTMLIHPKLGTWFFLAEILTTLAITLADERLTTVTATRMLSDRGVRGRAQRRVIDQAAAVEILQSFLDRRRSA